MKKISILLSGLIILCLMSCSKITGIKGNGNVVTEHRNYSSISKIKSSDSFDVYIIKDSINSVVVEAEENLLPYIETKVKDGELVIKSKNRSHLKNTEPIKIYLNSRSVSSVSLAGSGCVKLKDIDKSFLDLKLSGSGDIDCDANVNILEADISGSGKILLTGIAEKSDFHISGSGSIKSYNLEQERCFAHISGTGEIYATVSELLDVNPDYSCH